MCGGDGERLVFFCLLLSDVFSEESDCFYLGEQRGDAHEMSRCVSHTHTLTHTHIHAMMIIVVQSIRQNTRLFSQQTRLSPLR